MRRAENLHSVDVDIFVNTGDFVEMEAGLQCERWSGCRDA
jgi:hypothetical protein